MIPYAFYIERCSAIWIPTLITLTPTRKWKSIDLNQVFISLLRNWNYVTAICYKPDSQSHWCNIDKFQDSKFLDSCSHTIRDCFWYCYQLIQNRFQLRNHFVQGFAAYALVELDKGRDNLVLDHHRSHFQIQSLNWWQHRPKCWRLGPSQSNAII